MKQSAFIIFLTVALTLYALVNFYIVRRGLHALPLQGWPRNLFWAVMIFLAAAYPLGRWCERTISTALGDLLIHIGAYYLAVMLFALMLLLVVDIFRLADHFIHFFPQDWRGGHNRASLTVFYLSAALISSLTLAGAINARFPRVRHLAVKIEKPAPIAKMRLVLATDVHLGTLIHNSRMQELVRLINAQSPDLICFGGDLFDEDVLSLSRQNMAEVLQQLTAHHGVYAIPGNHEHISGIDRALEYMQRAGIIVLRDRAEKVADALWLIGRDDRQSNYFGRQRLQLTNVMEGVDRTMPLILLDHQPFHLEEAAAQGVDLQLSGHTHHGQLFPFQFITNAIYEVSWGYLAKGKTHYYVSCGAGTWGPPVRLGNRPEIVVIDLEFAAETAGTANR